MNLKDVGKVRNGIWAVECQTFKPRMQVLYLAYGSKEKTNTG